MANGTPTYRAASAKATGTTSATPNLPAGMSANDVVFLVASAEAGVTLSISANGSISTWNPVGTGYQDVTGGDKLYVWWGVWSSGSTGPTVASTGSDHLIAATIAYSNVSTANPIDVVAWSNETTSDTSYSHATGLTSRWNNGLSLIFVNTTADSNSGQYSSSIANSNLSSISTRLNLNTNTGHGGGFFSAEGVLATAGAVGTWSATMGTSTPKAYVALVIKDLLSPTKTGTSKADLKASITKTGTSKADIKAAAATKTGTSKSRIAVTAPTKTGTSKASIALPDASAFDDGVFDNGVFETGTSGGSATKTGTTKARIQTSSSKTGTAKARLTVSSTKTGTAKARVTVGQTKTGTSKARIQTSFTKTGVAKARIKAAFTKTGTSKADIKAAVSAKTGTSKARIKVAQSKTGTSKADIKAGVSKTSISKSRILTSSTKTGTSKTRITVNRTKTGTSKAYVALLPAKTGTSKARISVASTKTGTTKAQIKANLTKTGGSKSRVTVVQTKTALSKASIVVSSNSDVFDSGVFDGAAFDLGSPSIEKTGTSKASIAITDGDVFDSGVFDSGVFSTGLEGSAKISVSRARIQTSSTPTGRSKARIILNFVQTGTSKASISLSPTKSGTSKAGIVLNNPTTHTTKTGGSLARVQASLVSTAVSQARIRTQQFTTIYRPIGAGDVTQLTPDTPGPNWQFMADQNDDVVLWADWPGFTQHDVYTFGLPLLGGTIINVAVHYRAYTGLGLGTANIAGRLRLNGIEYNGTQRLPSISFKEYTDSWSLSPATGLPWTWAEVSVLQAGVALYRTYTLQPYVSEVWLTITQTGAVGYSKARIQTSLAKTGTSHAAIAITPRKFGYSRAKIYVPNRGYVRSQGAHGHWRDRTEGDTRSRVSTGNLRGRGSGADLRDRATEGELIGE